MMSLIIPSFHGVPKTPVISYFSSSIPSLFVCFLKVFIPNFSLSFEKTRFTRLNFHLSFSLRNLLAHVHDLALLTEVRL